MHCFTRICYLNLSLTFHKGPLLYLASKVYQFTSSISYGTMPPPRQALLLSSSNCYGHKFLEFAKEDICSLLFKNCVTDIIFVPYAKNRYDDYTAQIQNAMHPWGLNVSGLHSYECPVKAISSAKAIFVGGGNTFLLLKRLYENCLVDLIRKRVLEDNMIYLGSSAGTNVATRSVHTTNDMPIILPPSFDAIGIIPFNINPHYIDCIENDKHKGETRDERIMEFLEMPHAGFVLGLREGSMLKVHGNKLTIAGVAGGVVFTKNEPKKEVPVGCDVSYLMAIDNYVSPKIPVDPDAHVPVSPCSVPR